MAYGNNNYGNGGNYGRKSYGNSYNNGGYNQTQFRPKKKRTGCKSGFDKNGNPFVRGWRATRQFGLITYLCVPYKNTAVHTSKAGRDWHNWMVKVSFGNGQSTLKSCLYDPSTKKVIIAELGLVLNPSKDYCGSFTKRK